MAVTHQSLYDGTVEGFRHRERPLFCVQYHPEASPGPHDADYLFGRFVSSLAARPSARMRPRSLTVSTGSLTTSHCPLP